MGKRSEDKRARRKARLSQKKQPTPSPPSAPAQYPVEVVPVDPRPQRTTVLVTGDRQYGYDGELDEMQCVAKTVRGTRCGNFIEIYGQVAKWDVHGRYRLDWEVDDSFWLERYGSAERLYGTYVRQRCKLHLDRPNADAVAPEVYEIGPLDATPEDVIDTISRRVYPALMHMTSREQRPEHAELIPAVNAAAKGDLTALLALASRHPLPADLEYTRHGVPDPNYVNAGLWLKLMSAWEQGRLTTEQIAQCLAEGAAALV